ncbi:MAG TPA: hypothetical protein VHG92_02240 [Afifellaceae bacterium]|nr:hypothetical protein [Afifellaceae bacterium]
MRIAEQAAVCLTAQKHQALRRIHAAWDEALGEGIEPEVLAHVALFTALSDLVRTYGEAAVAGYAERLAERISDGAFTLPGGSN